MTSFKPKVWVPWKPAKFPDTKWLQCDDCGEWAFYVSVEPAETKTEKWQIVAECQHCTWRTRVIFGQPA